VEKSNHLIQRHFTLFFRDCEIFFRKIASMDSKT